MVHNKIMSHTTIMSSTLRNSSSTEGSWIMNMFLLERKQNTSQVVMIKRNLAAKQICHRTTNDLNEMQMPIIQC